MDKCYLCDEVLTKANRSKEHILLQSLGGKLKPKDLLCKACNSTFGHQADAELSKQLSILAGLLQVERDDGEKNQPIRGGKTKSGKEYALVNGSRPIRMGKPDINIDEDNGIITISAKDDKDAIEILKGLKRKHTGIDVDYLKQKFQKEEYYLKEPLYYDIKIGGELAFKSIAKTAINYYIHTQKDISQVKHLFEYLKGNEDLQIVNNFHTLEPLQKNNDVTHLIHLVGSNQNRVLYCFVEFFSAISFVILLSNSFDNPSFTSTYYYDILNHKEIDKIVELKLNREDFIQISKKQSEYFQIRTDKLNRLLEIILEKQNQKELNRILDTIFEKYATREFNEESIEEFSEELASKIVKFKLKDEFYLD